MSKEEQQTKRPSAPGSLAKFLPGGEFGPMTNRQEYEQRVNALPPEQREFAEESTRFADIWQYFSEHRMQLPKDVVNRVQWTSPTHNPRTDDRSPHNQPGTDGVPQ